MTNATQAVIKPVEYPRARTHLVFVAKCDQCTPVQEDS